MSEDAAKPMKKKKKGLSMKLRAQLFLADLMEVSYSAKAEEKSERVMARIAVACSALALFLAILGIVYVVAVKDRVHPDDLADAARYRLFMDQQMAITKQGKTSLSLGVFQLEIKRKKSEIPEAHGAGVKLILPPQLMAEFELMAECDLPETCGFFHRNEDLVRSEINAVLVPIDQEEVTSRDGRDKIKKTILQRLNALVPSGRLDGVYFNNFIVN